VAKIAGIDLSKAGAGLAASVILALTLPRIFPAETGGPRVAVADATDAETDMLLPAQPPARMPQP
jgi:hypothetical protein